MSPKLVKRVDPAGMTDEPALVCLTGIIGIDGAIHNLTITRSEGPKADQLATDAAKQWRYDPASLDGSPLEVDITISIRFSGPSR